MMLAILGGWDYKYFANEIHVHANMNIKMAPISFFASKTTLPSALSG